MQHHIVCGPINYTMNIPSKTFCILPWIHIYANADGNVLPCCIGDYNKPIGNLRNSSPIEIWNNDKYKQLRRNMLLGNKSPECSACYKTEAMGVQSFRENSNKDYKKYISLARDTNVDGSLDEMTLRYFDIRWSNICNFRCRSCSGTYSSSLAKEEKRNKIFIFAGGDNNDNLYEQFLPYFKDVDHFYFAGGEPLLTDKHYDILNYLISIGKTDINLSYNSNISNLNFKKTPVTELWNKFKSVYVMASIDSWGSRAEYMRDGTDWKVIEDNIRTIHRESPHVNLQTNTVVSVFNVYTIPEFIDYMLDSKLFDSKKYDPQFYNILNPEFYSASVIPDSLKNDIIRKLETTKFNRNIQNKFRDIISYLKTSQYSEINHRQFIKTTDHFDSIRNQDFEKTFPELVDSLRIF